MAMVAGQAAGGKAVLSAPIPDAYGHKGRYVRPTDHGGSHMAWKESDSFIVL